MVETDEEWAKRIAEEYFWRGLILVDGPPGAGMDLFVQHTKWQMKKYLGKKILDGWRNSRIPFPKHAAETIAKNFIAQHRKTEMVNMPEGLFPYTEKYGKVE